MKEAGLDGGADSDSKADVENETVVDEGGTTKLWFIFIDSSLLFSLSCSAFCFFNPTSRSCSVDNCMPTEKNSPPSGMDNEG